MTETSPQKIIVIGAGLAGLLSAYHILNEALKHKRKVDVTVIADDINAPCGAGSHVINEIDGFYISDDVPSPLLIKELRAAMRDLAQFVTAHNIPCRLNLAYEMKCTSEENLDGLIQSMIAKDVFGKNELIKNSDRQHIHLTGHDHSYFLDSAGQINAPEFLNHLVRMITEMGATIQLGVHYESHHRNDDGLFEIITNRGVFEASHPPLLMTGAAHQQSMFGDIFNSKIIYTMCCVFGPFAESDIRKVASRPIAFCDTNLHDDVLWGSVDETHHLSIGCGNEIDANAREATLTRIQNIARNLFPALKIDAPLSVHWGATLHTPNMMPIVGRMNDCIISGAWAGVGIVPAFVAGRAIAEWILTGDDTRLRIFEELQAAAFQKIKS